MRVKSGDGGQNYNITALETVFRDAGGGGLLGLGGPFPGGQEGQLPPGGEAHLSLLGA